VLARRAGKPEGVEGWQQDAGIAWEAGTGQLWIKGFKPAGMFVEGVQGNNRTSSLGKDFREDLLLAGPRNSSLMDLCYGAEPRWFGPTRFFIATGSAVILYPRLVLHLFVHCRVLPAPKILAP
jgi:hypothetical protein